MTLGIVAVMALGVYVAINGTTIRKNDLMSKNIEALSAGEDEKATCTFNEVYVKSSRNLLICRGNGSLCCKI